MHNPWTQTRVWRWPEERGWSWVEVGKGGKTGTSVIVSVIKTKNKKKLGLREEK